MASEIDTFLAEVTATIAALDVAQAETMTKRLATAFVAGQKKSGATATTGKLQERAIAALTKEQLGYITEFNAAIGKQIENEVKVLIADGKGYAEIREAMKPYIKEVFGPDGLVELDRVGKTRTVIQVDKAGKLHRVEKVIKQPYRASMQTYSDLLSRTSTHAAYEEGRNVGYQEQGFTHWRFVGPDDERARPHHVAVLGNVYEYDTDESDMAMSLLTEPYCRHRSVAFFNDPELDTPQEFYDDLKKDSGIQWDADKKDWGFKEEV